MSDVWVVSGLRNKGPRRVESARVHHFTSDADTCARLAPERQGAIMRTEERRAETARARRIYDRIAPHYDQLSRYFERLLYGGGREWVSSRAHGCVLEIGVGTGRNLPLYPRDVQVIGIDVSAA